MKMKNNIKYNIGIDFASNSYKDKCSENNFDINYSICKSNQRIFDFDNYVKDCYNFGISTVDSLFFINNVCFLIEFKTVSHNFYDEYDLKYFFDRQNILLKKDIYELTDNNLKLLNCEINNFISKKSIYNNLKLKAIESYNLLTKIIFKDKKYEMKYFIILKDEQYILEQQKQSENHKKSIKESLKRLQSNSVLGYYFNEVSVMSSNDFISFYNKNIDNIYLDII